MDCKIHDVGKGLSEKGLMSTAKGRRRNKGRSTAYKPNRLTCATCGRELHLRFVHVRGGSFCSGIHAQEFSWDLDEPSVKLEPGNSLIGGSNGCLQIEPGNVVSKEKKEGLEDV